MSVCLKIELDSPISERASELAKSEACRPKGGSHGKAAIVLRQRRTQLSPQKRVTKKHSVSVCLVGLSGLEPPTPTLSGWCSNLLSYNPIVCGGDTRIRLIASDCACTLKRASARACPRGHHKVMRCARNGMRVYSPMVEIHGFEPRTS